MRKNSVRLVFTILTFIFFYCIIQSCSKHEQPASTRRPLTYIAKTDIKYGSNTDWQGNTENLLLDVYMPANVSATDKLPLIVYVHGGGFEDGTKEDKKELMIDFASSGFVAVSIDYRLGWTQGANCDGDTIEAKEAVYRAVQDARAAIRFLVANANTYSIDTSRIFLGGESAGAITVLSTNYYTQSYANSLIPGVQNKLGALDDADNNLTARYTIKGIASVAGCLNTPYLINAANVKPTIYMHGLLDIVIPYDSGHNYNCKNFSVCYGDYYLYNVTKKLVPSVMHLDSTGTHVVYDENFIKTNEVCFFNSLMNGSAKSGFYTNSQSSCQ